MRPNISGLRPNIIPGGDNNGGLPPEPTPTVTTFSESEYRTVSSSNAVTLESNTYTKIPLDNDEAGTLGNLSPPDISFISPYEWIVPEDGWYIITAAAHHDGMNENGQRRLRISIDNDLSEYPEPDQGVLVSSGKAPFIEGIHLNATTSLLKLNVNQKLSLYGWQNTGGQKTIAGGAWLSAVRYGKVSETLNGTFSSRLEQVEERLTPKTVYFHNKTYIDIDFTENYRPIVETWVFDSSEPIPMLSASVVDNITGQYSGEYVTVGVIDIDEGGEWDYGSSTNLLKSTTHDHYLSYNRALDTWGVLTAENLHTQIDSQAASEFIPLIQSGSLPASYGGFNIDIDLSVLDTSILSQANPSVSVSSDDNKITISFGNVAQSGLIFYK